MRGPKFASMLVLPAERLQFRHAHGDEMVPLRGGFLAAEHQHALAAGGFAVRHPHLHEIIRAQHVSSAAASARRRTLQHRRIRLRRLRQYRRNLCGARAPPGRAHPRGGRRERPLARGNNRVDQGFRRGAAQDRKTLQRLQRRCRLVLAFQLTAAAFPLGEGHALAVLDRGYLHGPGRAHLVGAGNRLARQIDIGHFGQKPAAGEDLGVENFLQILSGIRHRHRQIPNPSHATDPAAEFSPEIRAKGSNSRFEGKGQGEKPVFLQSRRARA
jgi:hypothetical protein